MLVPLVVAWQFGATAATDSFFFALASITVVVAAASGVGQTSAVPDLVEALTRKPGGPRVADEILSVVVMATVAACVLVAALLTVWPGVPGEPREAAWHALALIPYAACAASASVAVGLLAADRRFARGAASLALRWAGGILTLLAFQGSAGVGVLAAGLCAGEVARILVLRTLIARRGLRYPRFSWPSRGGTLFKFIRNSGAQFAGSIVLAATLLVDRLAVAGLGDGSVSLLEYAERLWQVPVGLVMTGVLAVALTEWSRDSVAHGTVSRRRVAQLAAAAATLTLPLAIAGWMTREALTRAIFGSARLSADDLGALGGAVGAFVAITPIYVAGLTYSRALLAERRAHWLLGVALVQMAIKVIANAPAVASFGLVGIPVTTAVMYAAALGIFMLVPVRPLTADRAASA